MPESDTITLTRKELTDLIKLESRKVIIEMIKTRELTIDTSVYTSTHRLSYDRDVLTSVECNSKFKLNRVRR